MSFRVLCGFAIFIALSGTSPVAGSEDADIQQQLKQMRDLVKAGDSKVKQMEQAHSGFARKLADNSQSQPRLSTTAMMKMVNEVLGGALVLFMGSGAAMSKAGGGRGSLTTSASGACGSLVGWYFFGYAFGFGGPFNPDGTKQSNFVGTTGFVGTGTVRRLSDEAVEPTDDPSRFFYYWACSAFLSCIVSSALSFRIGFLGDMIFTFFMTAFIWPCVVGPTWGNGFLATMNDIGYVDQLGSGIIFLTAGISALLGCIIAGRRYRRFPDDWDAKKRVMELPEEFWPGSLPLFVTGTFMTWFGWYGLAVGSIRGNLPPAHAGLMAAHLAMNITISAAAGGLVVFGLRYAMSRRYDITGLCNGILAGLVSISAGCGNMDTGSALFTGILGALFYQGASVLVKVAKIDDQSDAFAIYGVCGIWGCLAAAFFDWGAGMGHGHGKYGFGCVAGHNACNIEGENLGGHLFVANLALIFYIILWVGILSAIIFLILKLLKLLGPPDEAAPEVKEAEPDVPLASI